MPGGGTDPAPGAAVPQQVRVHQYRDGAFRLQDNDIDVDYGALLVRLLVDLRGRLSPTEHTHPYNNIPPTVLAFAVGTAGTRPSGAQKVLWFAAGFPANAVDEDIVIIDAAFG